MKKSKNARKSAAYRRVKIRKFISGILLIAVLAAIFFFTPVFSVSSVTVTGNKILSDEDVIAASGIKKGDNFIFLNTSGSEKAVNNLGYVDKVKVKRKFFTRIEIEVVEAVEVAYVAFSGKYIGVDINGKVLSVNKTSGFKPKKAVISGLGVKKVQKGEILGAKSKTRFDLVCNLMQLLKKKNILKRCIGIDVSDIDDIFITLDSGTRICFGNSKELEYKMEYAEVILENQPNVQDGLIDIRNTSNVIYHPEEGGKGK